PGLHDGVHVAQVVHELLLDLRRVVPRVRLGAHAPFVEVEPIRAGLLRAVCERRDVLDGRDDGAGGGRRPPIPHALECRGSPGRCHAPRRPARANPPPEGSAGLSGPGTASAPGPPGSAGPAGARRPPRAAGRSSARWSPARWLCTPDAPAASGSPCPTRTG